MVQFQIANITSYLVLTMAASVTLGCGGSGTQPPVTTDPSIPSPPSDPETLDVEPLNKYPLLPVERLSLAQRFETGNGVAKDLERASYWAYMAARSGNAEGIAWLRDKAGTSGAVTPIAQLYLAMALGNADATKHETEIETLIDKAFPAIKARAAANEATAQLVLGKMYQGGWGPDKDEAKAVEWYRKAAEQNNAPAQFHLALALAEGRGVAKNPTQAFEWHLKAAELGDPAAQNSVGIHYADGIGVTKDAAKGTMWFRKSAAQGNASAQLNLGRDYYHGKGVGMDRAAAFQWIRRAAEQGDAGAQQDLSVMFRKGEGTPQDLQAAFAWNKKAAENGDPEAQLEAGDDYREGTLVAQDLEAAAMWYQRALEGGDKAAKTRLAALEQAKACKAKASTVLFTVQVKCAFRGQLRQAVRAVGGRSKREDNGFWYDLYDSSSLLDGSKELQLGFTQDGEFAKAIYVFPSHLDRMQVRKVADMVVSKYGPPKSVRGNLELGEMSYTWLQPDGIELRVHRGWPDTTTFLEFTHPTNTLRMTAEIEGIKTQQQQDAAQRQSNAF
jgi:TPR repeat protein